MTATNFDASKLEPGTPELEHGSNSEAKMILAYSQAVSLKRIADALEILAARETAQRDHAKAKAFAETAATLDAQEAADQPGADSEGWIPWHGGKCPVLIGAIDFRMRDGEEIQHVEYPDKLDWSHSTNRDSWEIIAYRVHED